MKIAVIATTEGAGSTFTATNLAYSSNGIYLDVSKNQIGHTFFECNEPTQTDLLATFKSLSCESGEDCANCVQACHKKKAKKSEDKIELLCVGCPEGDCNLSCEKGFVTCENKSVGTLLTQKCEKVTLSRVICKEHDLAIATQCALKNLGDGLIIIDCPPADNGYTLDLLKLCDYVVIVAEPGAVDFEGFKSLVRLCKLASKPYGLIINKFITQYDKLFDYCNLHSTDVLAKIPHGKREAKIISAGKIIAKEKFTYKQYFTNALVVIKKRVK